jgi:hypothetical protein
MGGSGLLSVSRWTTVALISLSAQVAMASTPRTVLELFTSQGCSSCPPADALVGRFTTDPTVLVLSFHVTYWDDLGWKDPFASDASTERQYGYAHALGERTVFTPQLIVNGTQSLVGSQERAVQHAVETSNGTTAFPVRADLTRQPDGRFVLSLAGPKITADVWELRYVRRSVTRINSGENGGRTLETYNNVTQLRRLGAFTPGTLSLQPLKSPEDGIAVIVQAPGAGRLLGAAAD